MKITFSGKRKTVRIIIEYTRSGEFDYYVMRRKKDKAYPLVKIVRKEIGRTGNISLIYIELKPPIPPVPVLADFLAGPEIFVSERVSRIMIKLKPEGVTFIPTKLIDKQGNLIKDYVCVDTAGNTYPALDKERSDYTCRNNSYIINKLFTDKNFLRFIPLRQRLIFRLSEAPTYSLFHQSVVDAISNLNPAGLYFQNAEDYTL